jgi:hypothetical protein
MTAGLLRWAGPETAAAYYELCALAPQLAGLIYCRSMPEKPLSVVLDWSEDIVSPHCPDAFCFNRLREVLPALVTAFVAAYTYSRGEGWGTSNDVVELYDAGCGGVVAMALPLAGLIAVALHGEERRALAAASRDDLAATLSRIHAIMSAR